MKCPYCENPDTKVIDSRPTEEGHAIRRRRGCEKCGKRFTTYEKVEESIIMIIKKDGRRESFDRNKVMTFIGELIMEQLKKLDEVAYVRFASVYRQFTDVNTFIKEIEKLIGNK